MSRLSKNKTSDCGKRAFFAGAAMAIDMSGNLPATVFERIELDNEKALGYAWKQVGECIASALMQYEEENAE